MTSLLNSGRPPLFCPGCSHEKVVHGLDRALHALELTGEKVAIVSDIGCSGLFDTFFNTHALHGLHGRALTYAAGLKMARPELTVIVIMGDGVLGIGGAHVLSCCRRNMDITLLIVNIKSSQRALAALAVLANEGTLLNKEMLAAGISHRYHGKMLEETMLLLLSSSSAGGCFCINHGHFLPPENNQNSRQKTTNTIDSLGYIKGLSNFWEI